MGHPPKREGVVRIVVAERTAGLSAPSAGAARVADDLSFECAPLVCMKTIPGAQERQTQRLADVHKRLCGVGRSEILGLRRRLCSSTSGRCCVAPTPQSAATGCPGCNACNRSDGATTRLAPAQLDPDARVFPGEKAGAMDASALYRRYVKAQQRAGIRRLRFQLR